MALCHKWHRVSRQRLRTAMQRRGLYALLSQGLHPVHNRRDPRFALRPNRLLDQLKPTQATHMWVSDITYLPIANGTWTYLCAFQDLASKLVLGWHVAAIMHARRTHHHGFTTGFLGPNAHPGASRAF